MILQEKKLRVISSGPIGTHYVFQDGSAADPSADVLVNDAFGLGWNPLSTETDDQIVVELETLASSYDDGKVLTFLVKGKNRWKDFSTPQFQVNSLVEFWAVVPTTYDYVATDPWHLNEVAPDTQVRWFRGWIQRVSASSEGEIRIECRDARVKSNDVLLQRDIDQTVTVPRLVFNAEIDSDLYFWSVKIKDPGSPTPSVRFGTGIPSEPTNDARLTVAEILEYLEDRYGAALTVQGVYPDSGPLFEPSDLLPLTIKPATILLENATFGQAVLDVLRWVPERRLMIDHQTGQWRIIPVAKALTEAVTDDVRADNFPSGTPTGNPQARIQLPFGATIGDYQPGQRYRIFAGVWTLAGVEYGPEINEEFTVESTSGSQYVWATTTLMGATNPANGQVYPALSKMVLVENDALPTIGVSVDSPRPGDVQIETDANDVASAVKIWSTHQETKRTTLSNFDAPAGIINPAWNTSMESAWKPEDEDRTQDVGAAGGGMSVLRIIADTDGKALLYIAFDESSYGADHAVDEWEGCSCWAWTSDYVNVRDSENSWTVLSSTPLQDIGDTRSGQQIKIDVTPAQMVIDNGGFFRTEDVDGTADRVILTQDFGLSTTTGNNKRWEVGRKWVSTETTTVRDVGSSPHSTTCRATRVRAYDGSIGSNRPMQLLNPSLGYPSRALRTVGPWEQLAGGGLGSFQVWRLAGTGYTQKPLAGSGCGLRGYVLPRLMQMEMETTTTTIREARFPASGFSGLAKLQYDLDREIPFLTHNWTDDSQDADYEDLVQRLHYVFQRANHRASVTLPGITDYAVLIDLAMRGQLVTASQPAGGSSGLTSFWGPFSSVTLDFAKDSVAILFDSRSPLRDVALRAWEDAGVKQAAKIDEVADAVAKLNQLVRCRTEVPPRSHGPGDLRYPDPKRPSQRPSRWRRRDRRAKGAIPD